MSIIFIFLDGIGLAAAGPDNPLTDLALPHVRALLGGSFVSETRQSRADLLLAGIDATLGVPGLPQSGTGQTALLTGMNAARLHGRHQPHFPPVALRPMLAERNILRQVVDRGGRAAFVNAFTAGYWEALAARRIRASASVIAATGAGVRFRTLEDLRIGRALSWDITGAALRARISEDLSLITPVTAGVNLARLARDYDLVFYETFLPDLAGHKRLSLGVSEVMGLIDGLVGGVLEAKRPADTLLITSDHGNIESLVAPAHTRNPVPLLVAGDAVPAFIDVHTIADVAGAIMKAIFDKET